MEQRFLFRAVAYWQPFEPACGGEQQNVTTQYSSAKKALTRHRRAPTE
jgi:hypothetical protein